MARMSLRDAIDWAIQNAPGTYGSEAYVAMSMHDDQGYVVSGIARPVFVADLALRGTTATIDTGSSTTTGIGRWFTRQPTPGFTTRDAYYDYGHWDTNYYLTSQNYSIGGSGSFDTNQRTAMDFSVRRDPGIPILQWLRGGPSVQIEIEAGPKALTLNADEDGLFLRAVGASIVDPAHRAIYTVTLDVQPIIP
ncbi:MAG TPA: hypothetical protein VGR43_08640 [Dehalococcoidia bacterium]|nr:hypothetical protein [Dehalococcoidia bacterium]